MESARGQPRAVFATSPPVMHTHICTASAVGPDNKKGRQLPCEQLPQTNLQRPKIARPTCAASAAATAPVDVHNTLSTPAQRLRGEQRRRKDTRRVSFLRLVKYREIASLADYTSDELEVSWYTDYDFDLMREQTRPVIKKMRRLHRHPNGPIDIDPEEDCFIGLDHLRSRSVLEDLRQRREELTIAVLSKQMDGRRREIASTARALTEQSRRDARERGLYQAHEANLAWRTVAT